MTEIIKKTSSVHTSARSSQIKYIVIHYTASASSKKGSARNIAAFFSKPTNQGGRDASADFIVDDVEIVQYNPDILKRNCWHCGDKLNVQAPYKGICKNSNSIGIEICSMNKTGKATKYADDGNWYFTDAALKNAVELTKMLMAKYNIPASNVIRHRDVTGKGCPGTNGWYGSNQTEWQWFKSQLLKGSEKVESENGYIVEVNSPDGTLNLRDNPKNGNIVQVLKNGQRVRIVAMEGNWGMNEWNRWLNLNYTKVVG